VEGGEFAGRRPPATQIQEKGHAAGLLNSLAAAAASTRWRTPLLVLSRTYSLFLHYFNVLDVIYGKLVDHDVYVLLNC
jgi:hypothetical protein